MAESVSMVATVLSCKANVNSQLFRIRCGAPGSNLCEAAFVDDRHRSRRCRDDTVSPECVEFPADHLARRTGRVSQALMADVRDQASADPLERYLAKMARDPHRRRLSGFVGNGGHRARRRRPT